MGLNVLETCWGWFKARYLRSLRASILAIFAVAGPVVIGAAGMAIDTSQAYLVRERLSHALDAAALAAAGIAATDEAAADARLNAFMNANYPPDKLGATYNLHMSIEGDNVHVSANADYNTAFLWILGIEVITVYAETAVKREVQGLEVVLVLDNTGSMANNNNISALKSATRNFINILFANTSNPEAVKIGLVPYSNAVRVGLYGLGKNPDGSTYGDGDVFVTLPSDVSYTANHDAKSGWYGCVVEHNPNGYNSAASYVSGSKGQLWRAGGYLGGHGWDPASSYNDPYPADISNDWEGPWDIYQYGKVAKGSCQSYDRWGNCTQYNYDAFSVNSTPNNGCPYANVVPLTSDQAFFAKSGQ
ncbi:MAG: VWA domain-containing protein [Alphaproteobacteria bacterium]|nr:VWA domain-containing protein [Alphaproteobacteria bacterium]